MFTTGRPLDADFTALRSQLDGSLVHPGNETWDAARQAWNLAVDQRPALVALPHSSGDVQALVGYARRKGLRIAMQGTGHNAAPMGALDGTMLVRTSEMRGVTIDAGRRFARVEAGALWAEVTAPPPSSGLRRSPAPLPTPGIARSDGMARAGRD